MPRILVADDNPLTLQFFTEAIRQLGGECVAAVDGRQAVILAAAEPFDLLLFDARMPRLDGPGALKRIRSGTGPTRHVGAWATTASNDPDIHRSLREAGFDAVVLKPISVEALHALLLQHLPELNLPDDRSGWLDDDQALRAAGGDRGIVDALRALLRQELLALPRELADLALARDTAALRDRLHRLEASAGFCGVPGLTGAIAALHKALDAGTGWPDDGLAEFRAYCSAIGRLLD